MTPDLPTPGDERSLELRRQTLAALRRGQADGVLVDALSTDDHPAVRAVFTMLLLDLSLERARAQIRRVSPLTPQERLAVGTLWELGPMTHGALARSIDLSPPATTGLVARLETRGVVSRRPDPEDGRRILVTLLDHRTPENVATLHEGLARLVLELADQPVDQVNATAGILLRMHRVTSSFADELAALDDDALRRLARQWRLALEATTTRHG